MYRVMPVPSTRTSPRSVVAMSTVPAAMASPLVVAPLVAVSVAAAAGWSAAGYPCSRSPPGPGPGPSSRRPPLRPVFVCASRPPQDPAAHAAPPSGETGGGAGWFRPRDSGGPGRCEEDRGMSIWASLCTIGWDEPGREAAAPTGVVSYGQSGHYPSVGDSPGSIDLAEIPHWCVPGVNEGDVPDNVTGPWLRLAVAGWDPDLDRTVAPPGATESRSHGPVTLSGTSP